MNTHPHILSLVLVYALASALAAGPPHRPAGARRCCASKTAPSSPSRSGATLTLR